MGNTLSESTGELYETELSRLLKEWALNKYKMDDSLYVSPSFQNILKKRACCTKQLQIPISIPTYDEKKKKLEFSAVNIPIFSNESDITPENCSFEKDRNSNVKQYYYSDKNGFILANQYCQSIYPTLCNLVKRDRRNYGNDYIRSYGPYEDSNSSILPGDINKLNTFVDCNCANSLYLSDVLNAQTINNVNPNSLAQTLDKRCSMNSTKTYKVSDERVNNLCLNNINVVGDIGVNNEAQLGLKQTCGESSTSKVNAPAPEMQGNYEMPTTPAPAPPLQQGDYEMPSAEASTVTTTVAPVASEESKKDYTVIIIISVIMVLLAGGGAFYRYRKSRT
jgi:hypothetical protein